MKLLRASKRIAMPWKNGGGVTREIAIFPDSASLDHFDWRISIAEVREPGPVSKFEGIDRKLALLEGMLSLTIDGSRYELSPQAPPLAFAGEAETCSSQLSPPVTDINVMTRRGQFESRMTRNSCTGSVELCPAAAMNIVVATSGLSVAYENTVNELEYLDAAVLTPRKPVHIGPMGTHCEYLLIELFQASKSP